MPDETQKPAQPTFEISEPEKGLVRVYANVSHLTWTGMDLTVQLYELVQPNRDLPGHANKPNELLHTASVTLTWPVAKTFHKLLGGVLERYEKAYGPINTEFRSI